MQFESIFWFNSKKRAAYSFKTWSDFKMSWPISNHESPDVDLSIPSVTAPHYLWAILSADGTSFREKNYESTRVALRAAIERFTVDFHAEVTRVAA